MTKKLSKICTIFAAIAVSVLIPVKANAKSNITVVIDPGHGGPATVETNLGATYNGMFEKDIDLATATALKNELQTYGNVTVYMTRTSDVELSLKQRVDYAKLVGADVIVSVHHNASSNHLFYGSEIFVPCAGNGYATGYGLASCIMNKWTADGSVNKGIKTRIGKSGDYYGLIRNGAQAAIPTIILEHGYIDNYHDVDRFNDAADWMRMGKLDAAGIASYYGLKKGTAKKDVGPTVNVKVPAGIVRDDVTGPIATAMTVEYYNPSTGEVRYTIYAQDPESRCMYQGASVLTTVGQFGTVIPLTTDLTLWNGKGASKGVAYVTPGYVGPIYGVCYNNFNLESNIVAANLLGAVGM